MSRVVSLPNHKFTGQALSSKRLNSIVHILLPEKIWELRDYMFEGTISLNMAQNDTQHGKMALMDF